ncbi:MAG: hypothetical protein RJQ02_00320 [Hyphomonas sp.]|uniref:hypothetical protein n=1 Tax=Hyphomonas sp. TaxID=87 RepID=UPI0032EAD9B9
MTKGLQAGFLYFVAVFAVGFAFGILRTLAVETFPGVTRLGAVLVEVPILLAVAWGVCGVLVGRFSVTDSGGFAVVMGLSAFLLLLSAEAGLSMGLNNLSLEEHFALYQGPSHLVGLIGQLFFAVFPWVRLRSIGVGAASPVIQGDQ